MSALISVLLVEKSIKHSIKFLNYGVFHLLILDGWPDGQIILLQLLKDNTKTSGSSAAIKVAVMFHLYFTACAGCA